MSFEEKFSSRYVFLTDQTSFFDCRFLGNMFFWAMCIGCWAICILQLFVSQSKNLNTLRTKRAFNMKQKAFFIIFIGFSVAKN